MYDSETEAREDNEVLRETHAAGVVHVRKHEKPTQRGDQNGIGIAFSPSTIVARATGGVIGHLWHGVSRGDVKELGEALDVGEAALVVGRSRLEEHRTSKRIHKQLEKELDKAASAG